MVTKTSAKPSVVLDRGGENRGDRSPLYHLILQEAFLATARDEFGARTYDTVLRELAGQEPAPKREHWDVISNFDPTRAKFDLTLNRKPGEKPKRTFKHKMAVEEPGPGAMEEEVALAERAMHHEFFDALRAEGMAPKAHAWHDDGAVGQNVEDLLINFSIPAQFDAIRKLHSQIEAEGESPQRLNALSRAYANLGLLTEHLWTTATKALAARSLIYAQRLCAKQPESAAAFWCRGYVRALAGRQHAALADFSAARQMSEKKQESAPAWGDLAEAFCKFDVKRLNEGAPEAYEPLARWFYYLAIEPTGVTKFMESVANAVLEKSHDAYRPLDRIASNRERWAQVGQGARYSDLAIAELVYSELNELDDAPAEVKELCKSMAVNDPRVEYYQRSELFKALRKPTQQTADEARVEPSWAALATLLEDVALAQACRSLDVDTNTQEGESPLNQMMPLFDDHPHRSLLGLRSNDHLLFKTAMQNAEKMGGQDLTICATPLVWPLMWEKWSIYRRVDGMLLGRADDTFYDQWRLYHQVADEARDDILVDGLLKIAPNMPVTVGGLLVRKPKLAAPHVEEWEKRYSGVPDVLARLGRFYRDDGKPDEAIRVFRQELALYPDHEAYSLLAEIYRQQGDVKNWLATWDDYFNNMPEQEQRHWEECMKIAWQLFDLRRWDDAWPYSKRLLDQDVAAGLETMACCAEGQQRWDVSEQNFAELSKNDSDPFYWYGFCRRTGKGKLDEAQKGAEEYIAQTADMNPEHPLPWIPAYYAANQKYDEAYKYAKQICQQNNDPMGLMHAAVLADRVKDTAGRDALLRRVLVEGPQHERNEKHSDVEVISLAEMLVDDLAAGGAGKIDMHDAARRCASATHFTRSAFYYFLGEYLDSHGQAEAAVACWKLAMLDTRMDATFRTLAGARLLDRKITPESYKEELQTPQTLSQRTPPAPPKLRHPPDAAEFEGHFYKFITDKDAAWTEAKEQAHYMGGHLAFIASEQQEKFVAELCKNEIAWLGGYRQEGKWIWITGEPIEYSKLTGTQTADKYLRMNADGTWSAARSYAGLAAGYVCQWDN